MIKRVTARCQSRLWYPVDKELSREEEEAGEAFSVVDEISKPHLHSRLRTVKSSRRVVRLRYAENRYLLMAGAGGSSFSII